MRNRDDGLSCPNPRERWLMAAGPPRVNCHRDEIKDPRTVPDRTRICSPGLWPFKRYICAMLLVAACSTAPQLQRVASANSDATTAPSISIHHVPIDGNTLQITVSDGHDIRFSRLSGSPGLSGTRVSQIVQDDLGFIWFGTQYGLDRYDGYHFKVFKHEDDNPNSLGGVWVTSLFKDSAGALWIGCEHSLDKFDPATNTFTHYRVDLKQPNRPDVNVKHISQDKSGTLWLSTYDGLFSLEPSSGRITPHLHDSSNPSSLLSDEVKSTGLDRSGAFWVADGEGLEQFDTKTGIVRIRIPLREPREFSFYEDTRGVFWIVYSSGNGLAVYDRVHDRVVRYSFNAQHGPGGPLTGVVSIVEDQSGTLWFGTLADGVLKLDGDGRHFTRYRNRPAELSSLAEDRITTLYLDREGDVWTGLGATEPNFFPTQEPPFKSLPFDPDSASTLGENLVNCLYEDRKGNLWIGTTGVLKRLDRKTGQYTHFAVPPHGITSDVLAIAEDRAGNIWAGTSGQGLYRLDPATRQTKAYRNNRLDKTSLSNDVVVRLLIDHAGGLWATTRDGLNRFDPINDSFQIYRWESRAHTDIASIAEDSAGGLWFGNDTSDVLRFDPATERFLVFKSDHYLSTTAGADRVKSLHVAGPDEVWFGTVNGLFRFNPKTGSTASYREANGMPSNSVSCILGDDLGHLWVSTTQGISKFDKATGSFTNYSVADGLPGTDLTAWGACFKSRSGEMFFGGFPGATAFYPTLVSDSSYSPRVVLTRFALSRRGSDLTAQASIGRAIASTNHLILPYSDNSFLMEFSALSFQSPSTNRYRYMLQSLDATWHEARSDQRIASYTTLPPGAYQFRAQGATIRGPWSEPGVILRITILPPWWSTSWFKAILGTLLVIMGLAAYRMRMRQVTLEFSHRLEERLGERTRIARELHDTLLQSFQGVLLRFQTVSNLLPGGLSKQKLDSVIEQAAEAITEGRDAVQQLRSSQVDAGELPLAVRTLGEELAADAANRGSAVFQVEVEGEPRSLHPILRDEIYRVAGEALRNAFRHAQAHRIEVEIRYDDRQLRLRVRDDGKGIDPKAPDVRERSGHWGLHGMHERARLVGGILNVWSEANSGTEVELTVPAAKAYSTSPSRRRSRWSEKLSWKGMVRKA